MADHSVQRGFFFALLFAVTLAFIWLIRGFLQPIFWAVALGIVMYPVHAWIEAKLAPRRSLAAGTSVLMLLLIVILPLVGIAAAVTNEATALVQRLSAGGGLPLGRLITETRENLPLVIEALERAGIDPSRIESQVSSAAVTASQYVASRALSIGQNAIRITIYAFLMLYLLFFFLRDGRAMLEGLVRALPIGDHRERHLLERFAQVSRATIKGTMVVGIVQGTIGGLAFAALGIGAPVLWGVVMAFLSIIPAVGPSLVWLPAAIILFTNGQIVSGIALAAIGVFVIGLVDNVLRPILVGRDTRMPDYLILLSTLGGLAGFGLAGIVIGPIIAAFFLSVWQMAEHEFGPEYEARFRISAPADDPVKPP